MRDGEEQEWESPDEGDCSPRLAAHGNPHSAVHSSPLKIGVGGAQGAVRAHSPVSSAHSPLQRLHLGERRQQQRAVASPEHSSPSPSPAASPTASKRGPGDVHPLTAHFLAGGKENAVPLDSPSRDCHGSGNADAAGGFGRLLQFGREAQSGSSERGGKAAGLNATHVLRAQHS